MSFYFQISVHINKININLLLKYKLLGLINYAIRLHVLLSRHVLLSNISFLHKEHVLRSQDPGFIFYYSSDWGNKS